MDYSAAREKMVTEQIIARGIKEPRVIEAMRRVERHLFVAEPERAEAYADSPVSILHNQTVSQPFIVALMTGLLQLAGTEKVLEIGTGSGYQTAVLAELAKEVYTIERFPDLAGKASALLKHLGYRNIKSLSGDGSLGWKEAAPFDRILITAACPRFPFPLVEQLREKGLIVAPLGEHTARQVLTRAVKKNGALEAEQLGDCAFVPLVGDFGLIKQ